MAALWEPLLTGALVFATVLATGGVLAAVLVWRYARRRWRAFHSHGLVVGARSLWESTSSVRFTGQPWSPEDVYGWTPRRVRKELWRAVDGADSAVRAASRAGAPTASLPELCRRLREVSVGLDRVLRVETTSVTPDLASQAIEVMEAASDVHRAAVASASDANGQRVSTLVRDARHEIVCLDAGLASAQAALPHHDR